MLTLACRGVSCGGQGGVTPCQSLHTFFWEESMGPCGLSRLWQQNYNLKIKSCLDEAVRILLSFQLSVDRQLLFLLREERAQRSGKGTALVPFQTPTKFRCIKQYGTTALVNSLREFVRGGSVSSQCGCSRQPTPWSPVRAAPPSTATELCSLWRVAEQTAGVKGV